MDANFLEEEVSIVNDNLRLAGTLCSPANHEANISILMVAGSGKSENPSGFCFKEHVIVSESAIRSLLSAFCYLEPSLYRSM